MVIQNIHQIYLFVNVLLQSLFGDIPMELSLALKQMRRSLKLTQREAASAAGVSVTQYQNYEYGNSEPSASVLYALAQNLGVSLDQIFGLNQPSAPAESLRVADAYSTAPAAMQEAVRKLLGME